MKKQYALKEHQHYLFAAGTLLLLLVAIAGIILFFQVQVHSFRLDKLEESISNDTLEWDCIAEDNMEIENVTICISEGCWEQDALGGKDEK